MLACFLMNSFVHRYTVKEPFRFFSDRAQHSHVVLNSRIAKYWLAQWLTVQQHLAKILVSEDTNISRHNSRHKHQQTQQQTQTSVDTTVDTNISRHYSRHKLQQTQTLVDTTVDTNMSRHKHEQTQQQTQKCNKVFQIMANKIMFKKAFEFNL